MDIMKIQLVWVLGFTASFVGFLFWICFDLVVSQKQLFQVNLANYIGLILSLPAIVSGFQLKKLKVKEVREKKLEVGFSKVQDQKSVAEQAKPKSKKFKAEKNLKEEAQRKTKNMPSNSNSVFKIKNFTEEQLLILFSVLVCIANGALTIFLLTRLDYSVNWTLFDYGLQFSSTWHDPFETYLHLAFVFIGTSVASNIVVFSVIFARKRARDRAVEKNVGGVLQECVIVADENSAKLEKNVKVETKTQHAGSGEKEKVKGEISEISVTCPYCKGLVSKYLLTLDFSDGKARLVNICPLCGAHEVANKDSKRDSNVEKHT